MMDRNVEDKMEIQLAFYTSNMKFISVCGRVNVDANSKYNTNIKLCNEKAIQSISQLEPC